MVYKKHKPFINRADNLFLVSLAIDSKKNYFFKMQDFLQISGFYISKK